ncbi:MAG: RsmB/NOP family class I SAM-dependent RNA methyltransferase [Cyanobacteria bacterium HKST-UBA03]|nr:RsmB/NOP family class I SAM-dependent RNA methyltransferase [Cyanobacteria bacterium HKST-UBA03]
MVETLTQTPTQAPLSLSALESPKDSSHTPEPAHADPSLLARRLVFNVLLPFELLKPGQRYRKPLADERFNNHPDRRQLSPLDQRFARYLMLETLSGWFALAQQINHLSTRPANRLDPNVRLLLRLGLCQLAASSRIPDYAAVSSTMNLAQALGLSKPARGFINAVLQGFIRQGKPEPSPDQYWPDWWHEQVKADQCHLGNTPYLHPALTTHTTANNPDGTTRPLTLRVNRLKTTPDAFIEALTAEGLQAVPHPDLADMVIVTETDQPLDIVCLPGFEAGWFYVQNPSSATVAHWINDPAHKRILDCCAAPGSKTTQLAALMNNTGHIVALDHAPKRLARLTENCQRLGVSNVTVQVADSTDLSDVVTTHGHFDVVLVDAPCSATGTLAKHPDVLISFHPDQLPTIVQQQSALLRAAASAAAEDGVLLYSTCSVLRAENEAVVQAFLDEQAGQWQLDQAESFVPDNLNEGFYIARLLRSHSGHTTHPGG